MNKTDIETDANMIWSLLVKHGTLSYRELAELTGFHDHMLMLSLGWLVREDKVVFNDSSSGVDIGLSRSVSEFYL